MKQLQLEKLVLGLVSTNCYFAKNQDTKELLLVDPAASVEAIRKKIEELAAKPVAILLTHGHFDHIGAAKRLKEAYNIPILALKAEEEVLMDSGKNLTGWSQGAYTLAADRYLTDGEKMTLAGFEIEVLHTPGHTIGSTCYYLPKEQVLFSGDTLFCCSVGRTDLPTGSGAALQRSIRERLFLLPEDTAVFPGHDAATTIEYEKKFNPYA